MADVKTEKQKLQEITEKLEQGITELFESDRYKTYLNTMSKFHNYSYSNTLLIAMQKPDATFIAGYNSWINNFERQVKKGEKAIRIFAPAPYKVKEMREKLDPVTKQPILDKSGTPVMEEVEVKRPAFKVVPVFDISQTEGKELPQIAVYELKDDVDSYSIFVKALTEVSPVAIDYEDVAGEAKGFFDLVANRIVIKRGMSESQTLETAIHEMAHAKLHNKMKMWKGSETAERKDRSTKEVEAESIAYTVCQHFGIDTSEYSFGYIAGWSSGKELKELKASLDIINRTASELINSIEEELKRLQLEHSEKAERLESPVVAAFKEKTEQLFHSINGQSQTDIEQIVRDYVQSKIAEYNLDIQLVDVVISGSRCRGLEKEDSDLDVVVEYKGEATEDAIFNVLNEENLMIGDVKVDINPITENQTGTLETYLPMVEKYLEEKQKDIQKRSLKEKLVGKGMKDKNAKGKKAEVER